MFYLLTIESCSPNGYPGMRNGHPQDILFYNNRMEFRYFDDFIRALNYVADFAMVAFSKQNMMHGWNKYKNAHLREFELTKHSFKLRISQEVEYGTIDTELSNYLKVKLKRVKKVNSQYPYDQGIDTELSEAFIHILRDIPIE